MGNEADSDSEGRDQMRREKWKQHTGSWYGITLSSNKQYTLHLLGENWIHLAYATVKLKDFIHTKKTFSLN